MLQRLFCSLIFLFAAAAAAAPPDIELRDLDGQPRNVNEFVGQGKWAIVVVWAHDCLICYREIHQMAEFHNARKDRDAIVLGVSIDGMKQIQEARQFAADRKLPFTSLLAEPEPGVMSQFDGQPFVGTPTHYFYDPRGRLVARKVGPLKRKDLDEFIEVFNASPYASQ
jgi:peroxiredoxin